MFAGGDQDGVEGMRVFNTAVYGLEDSLRRAGFPKTVDVDGVAPSLDRGILLGSTGMGEGHDNFLVGIVVQCDIEAPSYWWPEFQRYHFADIVSSQSKMHRLTQMDLKAQCLASVDPRVLKVLNEKITAYNKDKTNDRFEVVLANTPMGLELTAGITTNYRSLKTMWNQRHNHRQWMWREVFCPWMLTLPHFKELTGCGK